MPQFARYIGIDYSGAQTPTSSLSPLRVYAADLTSAPEEVFPPTSPRKHWTRKGIAEWLRGELCGPKRVLAGIDHAFSFPVRYFEKHGIARDWTAFLDDFQKHWPTDDERTYVCFLREDPRGSASKRQGDPSWFRLTELWTQSAKSVFQFAVKGQVATATHAGLPWLRYLRMHCRDRVHFWPFDGWEMPDGRSVVAEVYPSLWMRRYPLDRRPNPDQQAAYAVASWLQRADRNGSLERYLNPPLEPQERAAAKIEGWILGLL